jgi:hypothetical protein
MKIVNRKTRKAIRKSVKKVVKKHGAKVAAGLVGGIASTLATLASTEAPGKGKQTNLAKVSKKVGDMITSGGSSRKRAASKQTLGKSGKRGKRHSTQREPEERAL